MSIPLDDSTASERYESSDQFGNSEGTTHSLAEKHIQQQRASLKPSCGEQSIPNTAFPPIPSPYFWTGSCYQTLMYDSFQKVNVGSMKSRNRTDSSDIKFEVDASIEEMASTTPIFNKMLKVLSSSLGDILTENNLKACIEIKIENDIEYPEWEEIVTTIKIPNIENDKLFEIWGLIESKVREKTNAVLGEGPERDEYGRFVIVVNRLRDSNKL
jgi:hypothetical protein